jgi:DNA-binding transcriptional MerR regulator
LTAERTHDLPYGSDKDRRAAAAEEGGDARDVFSIRDLAKEFGVSSRTLRFYEERGLLSPRRDGLDRRYSRRDRARLRYVLMGKAVGFSLEEIGEMLGLYDLGDRQVTQLTVARDKFRARIARLERQKAEIDRAIAELAHASRLIEGMLATRERKQSTPTN